MFCVLRDAAIASWSACDSSTSSFASRVRESDAFTQLMHLQRRTLKAVHFVYCTVTGAELAAMSGSLFDFRELRLNRLLCAARAYRRHEQCIWRSGESLQHFEAHATTRRLAPRMSTAVARLADRRAANIAVHAWCLAVRRLRRHVRARSASTHAVARAACGALRERRRHCRASAAARARDAVDRRCVECEWLCGDRRCALAAATGAVVAGGRVRAA
jgi:hypothetical protein